MAISYRRDEPQQLMLLPASRQDWLPEGHLAYFISDTVDAMDLSAFYARYAGGGARNRPFHAATMLDVVVFGYASGAVSSRKIERKLHEDRTFRMFGAGNYPSLNPRSTNYRPTILRSQREPLNDHSWPRAALVPPPRIRRHRYFRGLARTSAHGQFPR